MVGHLVGDILPIIDDTDKQCCILAFKCTTLCIVPDVFSANEMEDELHFICTKQ